MFRKRYLTGGQAKLDANKDGKISGDDFKILRNKNKMTSDQKEKAMDTLKKYKGKPINPILKKTTGATKAKPLNRTNKFFGGAVRLGSAGLKYRSEEHTSELQSRLQPVSRQPLEQK